MRTALLILASLLLIGTALDMFVLNHRLSDWLAAGAFLMALLTIAVNSRRSGSHG